MRGRALAILRTHGAATSTRARGLRSARLRLSMFARLIAIFAASLAVFPAIAAVELTEEERLFIASRELVVGLAKQPWEPVDIPTSDGDYQGISADVLRHITKATGLRVRIQYEPSFEAVLEKTQWGAIDIAPSVAKTPLRSTFLQFTSPYYVMPTVFVTRTDVKDFSSQAPITHLRIAVDRGSPNSELANTIFPEAPVVEFESIEYALKGVATRQADVYIGSLTPAVHTAEKYLLSNLEIRGQRDLGFGELRFATASGNRVLLSILEKALAELSDAERNAIIERWRPVSRTLGAAYDPLQLTAEDRRYVDSTRKLRVAYLEDLAPLSSPGPTGRPEGMANDYFKLLTEKLGITADVFTPVAAKDLLRQISDRQVDIVIALHPTQQREQYLTFVGPLLSMETAIINRVRDEYILGAEQLAGKKVAVVEHGPIAERLRLRVPSARLVTVSSTAEMFEKVVRKEADALVEGLPMAGPKLAGVHAGTLKVSATLEDETQVIYIGVRNDMPHLAKLLTRAFDDLTDAEHYAIRNRWLTFETRTGVPWSRVALTIAVSVGAVILGLVAAIRFNRRLNRATVERGELAERYSRALAQAREAASSKTHLLSAVSHEVRSPLSAVIGVLDLLKTTELSEQQRRFVELAAGAARSQFELLGEILDYTNAEERTLKIEYKPTDLRRLSHDIVETFMAAASQKGLNLSCSIAPTLAPAHRVDAKRLRQIISNLINNAIKFTNEGDILVEVTAVDQGNLQRVMWRVRDTGIGIAQTDQAKLFQPFSQANETIHAKYGGTGLGLALCKALAAQLGGQLMLDSAPSLGTEVRLVLPLEITSIAAGGITGNDISAIVAINDTRRPPRSAASHSKHVLLVEGNASMTSALGELLQTLGCEVTAADNPVEAMKSWSIRTFDLVIADLVMPGLDGRELVRAMRAYEATDRGRIRTPIAVVAGDWSGDRREIAQELGVDAILQSPVDLESLRTLVTKLSDATVSALATA